MNVFVLAGAVVVGYAILRRKDDVRRFAARLRERLGDDSPQHNPVDLRSYAAAHPDPHANGSSVKGTSPGQGSSRPHGDPLMNNTH